MHLPVLSLRTRPGDHSMQIHPMIEIRYLNEKNDPCFDLRQLDVDDRLQPNSADQYRYTLFPCTLLRMVYQFPAHANSFPW